MRWYVVPVAAGLYATLLPGTAAVAINPIRQEEPATPAPFDSEKLSSTTTLVPFPYDKFYRKRQLKRSNLETDIFSAANHANEYELATKDAWYWGLENVSVPFGMVTCGFEDADYHDPYGRSFPVEQVMDDIQRLSCSETGLKMQFKDQASYNLAKQKWTWVNQAAMHYISMVALCGEIRQPYKISSYTVNDQARVIDTTGFAGDFHDVFPIVKLRISSQGVGDQHARRISIEKQLSVALSHDFSQTIFDNVNSDNFHAALKCSDCKTTGTLNFDLQGSYSFSPFGKSSVSASVQINPVGVAATADLDLSLTGALPSPISYNPNFVDFGLPGKTAHPLAMLNKLFY